MLPRRIPQVVSVTQRASRVRHLSTTGCLLQIDPRVQQALNNGEPVVALESTIVAHGMPYPENLQLAQEVEAILQEKGVTPATIAMRQGVFRVGLSSEELADLAMAGSEGRAKKCSTRDLAVARLSQTKDSSVIQWGATTVASTMRLAALAGISTFVTGGIGGVHRDGEVSMDVSADLTELGQTPVIVVSAGIKSILDIQRTMEVLETHSVPTMSWRSDEFPAFFSPYSGVPSPARVETAEDVAIVYETCRALGLSQGMLVAVPNNDPAGSAVEDAIQAALQEANEKGITGQGVTPFVLAKVASTTAGESLRSNMSLVRQNAQVGADIAIAIAERRAKN